MLMLSVFVSDNGQLLQPGDLRWILDYPYPDFDLANYAIRNLGFAQFKLDANGARLKLRADLFTKPCFERIVRLVVEQRVSRLVIEHEREGEPAEVLLNTNDIVARLDFLRGTTPGESPRQSFILETLDLGRLGHLKRRQMSEAYRSWLQCHGRLPGDFEPLKRVGGFQGGHLLVSLKGQDQAIVEDWPNSIRCYSPNQIAGLMGRDLSEQPDNRFGQWSSKPYYEVVSRQAARLDLVEAVIHPPGGLPMISRYERLLLPWRTGSGEFWVSGTSQTRSRRLLRSA